MDIQVGDLVTCKYKDGTEIKEVAKNEDDVSRLKAKPVIKIERPKYEVVEEKKELLTEEEKEFLKTMCKYYDVIKIRFNSREVNFFNRDGNIVNCPDYPKNMKFQNVKKNDYYTLKELGLEES